MATASEIFEDLLICRENRDPAMVWGQPGSGKSDLFASLAKHLKIPMIDFRAALRDPTDLKGMPMPDAATKTMKYFRDGELPTKGKGILFLDEANSAPQATQACFMQLMLPPFKIGDYTLPEGWWIGAAGNRESDRGVTHRMPTTVSNRFTHFYLDVELNAFVKWCLEHNQTAEDIAFVRFRERLLTTFDPKSGDHAFGTPRSWVKAWRQAKQAKNAAQAMRLVTGTVGAGNAGEYFGFLNIIKDLPSTAEIALNPDTVPVPTAPATLHAVTTALSMATTESGFARFMIYVRRIPSQEFQAVYVRDAMARVPAIKLNKEFVKWSIENETVIL